jgi:hypothetical protein
MTTEIVIREAGATWGRWPFPDHPGRPVRYYEDGAHNLLWDQKPVQFLWDCGRHWWVTPSSLVLSELEVGQDVRAQYMGPAFPLASEAHQYPLKVDPDMERLRAGLVFGLRAARITYFLAQKYAPINDSWRRGLERDIAMAEEALASLSRGAKATEGQP